MVRYVDFFETKLVDSTGQFHNSIRIKEAKDMAREAGLDLICFSKPDIRTKELGLCKIIDFGKWKYEDGKKRKKEIQSRKKQTKEVRFSPHIEDNDVEHKVKQINEFLDEGDDVVLTMKVFGRDRSHLDLAEEKMNKIAAMCLAHGKETGRKREGFVFIIRLSSNGINH